MPRPVRGLRPIFVLATLVVALLGLNAAPAFATHFRYGTIYWEKDPQYTIDHPGFYKVRVTLTAGFRWGFSWTILPGSPAPPTGGNRCAGTPVGGDNPTGGSCPPVGAFINLLGGVQGRIGLDKAPTSVTVIKGQGQNQFNPLALITDIGVQPNYGPIAIGYPARYSFDANGQVVSISPTTDTFYADLTFDVIYPISANPITVNYWQNARLSTLKDLNADQPYQLKAVIDANPPNLRSPIAAALPIISQVNAANFDLLIPVSSQPGTTSSLRFATAAESSLANPEPYGMAIDPVNKLLIHWTPQPRVPSNGTATNPSTGLYAVQFMLRSVVGANAPIEVPLDLLFNVNASCAQSPTCPTIDLTTPGNVTDFEAPIGQAFSTSVSVQVNPFTSGSKIALTNTPLPPGMTLTLSSQTVNPLTGTLAWLPTAASPENSVVCFQGDVTLPSTLIPIASNGMKCLNFLVTDPNDQPPAVTCSATPISVPATSLSGALVSLMATIAEPNLQATTVTFTEGAITLGTGSTAAGATSTNLFLSHTFSIGTHNVVTSAFDGKKTGSCTTQVIVTKKTQAVNFTSATTPLAIGSSRLMAATSQSGLPVSFSLIAGSPGSLAGTSLTATGLGLIEVKGSAPGDALYEPGQAIVQIATFDATPPTIAPHADVIAEATAANGAMVVYTAPATSDNVDPAGSATCSPASGLLFSLGETLVTCSASDAAGNSAAATSFKVIVRDTTGPAIDPHADETVEATSAGGATATYSAPATTDAVDGAGTAGCTPASPAALALGTHTITCTASDAAGNPAAATTFKITVKDTTAPVIAPHADVLADATSAAGAPVSYSSPATSDAVDGARTATCSPASGSPFTIGTHAITCNATDDAGNPAAPTTFNVIVADKTGPVIAAHADVTAEAVSASGAVVSYTSPATTDAVDGAGTASCSPASGGTLGLGTHTITCNATDAAGNAATATTFTVTVADTTKPVIAAHANVSIPATSPGGAVVTYSAPATSDAVSGAGTSTCSPTSGTTLTLGTHTVTCNATDGAGNAAEPTTFTVSVTNNAPTFTPHAAVTVEATAPSGAIATFTAGGTDVEDGPLSNAVCAPASGSTFPVGSTTVGCTVTDVAGATGSGSFPVHVVDTTKPDLSLPPSFTVEAAGPGGAVAMFVVSASDIVDVTVPVSCSKASGSVFPPGPTIVSCSATDAHGNTATGTFTVIVGDTTAPAVASVTPSQGSLWPANHQMVPITFAVVRSDTVDPSPVCSITSIVSNEPINGQGDGDTGPDWQFAPGSLTASIRAERAGGGSGRVYTVTVTCRDASGNAASNSTTVSVPKSQGK